MDQKKKGFWEGPKLVFCAFQVLYWPGFFSKNFGGIFFFFGGVFSAFFLGPVGRKGGSWKILRGLLGRRTKRPGEKKKTFGPFPFSKKKGMTKKTKKRFFAGNKTPQGIFILLFLGTFSPPPAGGLKVFAFCFFGKKNFPKKKGAEKKGTKTPVGGFFAFIFFVFAHF